MKYVLHTIIGVGDNDIITHLGTHCRMHCRRFKMLLLQLVFVYNIILCQHVCRNMYTTTSVDFTRRSYFLSENKTVRIPQLYMTSRHKL